ncbi:hypothetical protein CLMAG_28600 [Clostridium magnum DSM 2767]|uniref:Uncharacterized protein n=2 Tax=Clostridium magnum TaxID=33954 RepID=A0A161YKP2_9CLOT|nr:hypothetical protein CLMAG_28600 [Clostridium magnum DSM 2767]SHI18271.1 hypothetical protein SAMN02745944_03005 [Clostridium magnum DSM 2767]
MQFKIYLYKIILSKLKAIIMKGGIMDLKNIINDINDVNRRIEYEYNKWNETDDLYLIEECIWTIKSLEIRRSNLYKKAKKSRISYEKVV